MFIKISFCFSLFFKNLKIINNYFLVSKLKLIGFYIVVIYINNAMKC